MNDDLDSADRLATWKGDLRAMVNVNPFNEWTGSGYRGPDPTPFVANVPRGPGRERGRRGSEVLMFDWRKRFEELGLRAMGMAGFVPVPAEDIAELARRAGVPTLPPLLVEIATTYGNACFRANTYVKASAEHSFQLWRFDGGAADGAISLLESHEIFGEHNPGMPAYWIPFASDIFSQVFVIDGRSPEGAVYFQLDPDLVPVAPSFEAFLALIEAKPE